MKRMLKVALTIGAVGGFALCARGVKTEGLNITPYQASKVMNEYHGVKLGMKTEAVRTAMGKPESSSDTNDEFKLTGDDTMTVHYDNGEVKAIQLAFLDPKNAPSWKNVIGDAEIKEMPSGVKTARKVLEAEKYWVSMYQNKEGSITRITISR